MCQENFENLVDKGILALSIGDVQLALDCFEQGLQIDRNPVTCSNLAYCLAKVRGNYREAIALAREALDAEPDNPLHYLNFGRVLFLAGDKEQSLAMLRKGLEYGMHIEIIRELEAIGIRKPPLFKKLPRKNFFNRYVEFILSRLKLR